MKKFGFVAVVAMCLVSGGVVAEQSEKQFDQKVEAAHHSLDKALRDISELEPSREGSLHDAARGATVIVHSRDLGLPTPSIEIISPVNSEGFGGRIEVEILWWLVDPTKATSTQTQFANGHQEANTGHTHSWIYDLATGNRVRFTGANGLLYEASSGRYVSAAFTLPPGDYKLFVQLQNHDHTPPVQFGPQALPAFDAVEFHVD